MTRIPLASEKTLVDEFAGQALVGLCSSWYDRHRDDPETQRGHGPTLISQSAYTHAEAMVAEKARLENPPTERISIGSDDQRKALEAFKLIENIDHPEFDGIRLSIANLASRFVVNREAVVQQSSTTDAGKVVEPATGLQVVAYERAQALHRVAELEAANRELVEALESSVAFAEQWVGANEGSMLADARNAMLAKARAVLAKHKESK